jgi:sterol desaturase/sphingolipid hydroxylase (fatty acid hydroxylase superfamily)
MSVLIYYAIPAFFVLMVLEALLRHRGGARGYTLRDSAASLSMGVGNVLLHALTKGVFAVLLFGLYEHRLFDLGSSIGVWLLLIPAEDFCYYWFHRAHHEVRFLWAAHVNHHSSTYYNLSTALRQSWTTPLTGPWFWAPLPLLGFHPFMIVTVQATSLIYQFWLHTEHIGRLGPLEWIFNTPSHHRVHHGRNLRYLDKNYAGVFIIWDRLFGTFAPETEAVDYGLTKNIQSHNPVHIAFHEWQAMCRDASRAGRFFDAVRTLFNPPGWSPDGSTQTSRQLQRSAGLAPSLKIQS